MSRWRSLVPVLASVMLLSGCAIVARDRVETYQTDAGYGLVCRSTDETTCRDVAAEVIARRDLGRMVIHSVDVASSGVVIVCASDGVDPSTEPVRCDSYLAPDARGSDASPSTTMVPSAS